MSDGDRHRIRDVDSAETADRVRRAAWAAVLSVPCGLLGYYVAGTSDHPFLVTLAFLVGGFAVIYFVSGLAGSLVAGAAGGLYFSSGSTTQGRRQYSHAESLIVRGRLDEAEQVLKEAAETWPDDPQPALMMARLLRDRCGRPEESARWFRTAVQRSAGDAQAEIATLRESIELYTHALRAPRRALPDLARLASAHPDTPAGEWARREMAEIRRDMQHDELS